MAVSFVNFNLGTLTLSSLESSKSFISFLKTSFILGINFGQFIRILPLIPPSISASKASPLYIRVIFFLSPYLISSHSKTFLTFIGIWLTLLNEDLSKSFMANLL